MSGYNTSTWRSTPNCSEQHESMIWTKSQDWRKNNWDKWASVWLGIGIKCKRVSMLWSHIIIIVAWMQISGYDVIKKCDFWNIFCLKLSWWSISSREFLPFYERMSSNVLNVLGDRSIFYPWVGSLRVCHILIIPPPPACNQFSIVLPLYSVSGD